MDQDNRIPMVEADPEVGLTAAQVSQRAKAGLACGREKLAGKSPWEIFDSHTFTFFNLIFVALAAMLVIGGSTILNMGFLLVAVLNTSIGILQEIRAKLAVNRLSLLARRPVKVIRDGKKVSIPMRKIVRDDVAEFQQGDQICADGILCTGSLWVDESLLTGEADAVEKQPGDSVRSGSTVMAGRGRVRLTAVGADAYAIRLAQEARNRPSARKSEMMRALDGLIRFIGILLIPVGLLLFGQEFFVLKLGLRGSIEGTVAALVGMIPEGLYLLTSIALAVSTLKLSRKKVLVQDMNCIETLARVDVLCLDKTGTITRPEMEVAKILPLGEETMESLETILTELFGPVEPDNETAKAIAAQFSGKSSWECQTRIPFSAEYQWSGAAFSEQGSFLAGAPDAILADRYDTVREEVETWTAQGCRVLLCGAYGGELAPGKLDSTLVTPLGLILLNTQLRENAAQTFRYFEEQGVSVRVISGDSPKTASLMAQRAGISGADRVVDGAMLDTDSDFDRAARDYVVFGRMTPDKKRRLVAALQGRGHTVAMAGDGVNDLLAMKQADCSVALGSGAEAANRIASMVLLKNDFDAMTGIVAEGRRVINNIQRAAALFLVKNIFSLLLALVSLFTRVPYPFQPIHLTLVGALTIGIPGFFLALEPSYQRVRGRFLWGALRKALPGGLTNLSMVVLCQVLVSQFHLPETDITTVCAAMLAVVGLLVLFQISRPMGVFRGLVWGAMAAALVVCFTVFGGLFSLALPSVKGLLLLGALLLMAPTVFFALWYLLNWERKKKTEEA